MQQNIQNGLNDLMQKDMDRKDFLKHVGIGFVAIMGISGALKTMSQFGGKTQSSSVGYGASTYGGRSSANASQRTSR